MGRPPRRSSTHQVCNSFAETDEGFMLVCRRSLGHKAELCCDQDGTEFQPDHPRVLSSKRPPRRS